MVLPVIQPTPAKKPSTSGQPDDDRQLLDQREREQQQRRCSVSAMPNSRRRESPCSSRGPRHMPSPRPGEDGAEQHAVAGVATAEVGDEGPRQPDHHAAGREGADDADHQAAYDGRGADVLPAVDDHPETRCPRRRRRRGPRGMCSQPGDHDAGDDEGERVEVERQVDRAADRSQSNTCR